MRVLLDGEVSGPPARPGAKLFFFIAICAAVISMTAYLVVKTVRDNTRSVTGGPVHWHADFRVFQCGEELDLVDPRGLENKVGSAEVHEHGDNRIHIEGTLAELREASLGYFFEAVGGYLRVGEFGMPTENGFVSMKNGDRCPDGRAGRMRVFLWETENGVLRQRELADPAEYVIAPEALVPPGDCVIVEFTADEKSRPGYLCEQYEAAQRSGTIKIE